MNQKLINAKALFQGHIPFRHHYYRYCRKLILNGIRKKALSSLKNQGLMTAIHAIMPIGKEEICRVSDSEKKAILESADKIMGNTFNCLGSGDMVLNPICWDTDFISGFKWEKGLYYRKYVQVNLGNHADVKVPRELSRSHFLLHLALAFCFTGDEKYAKKTFSLIEDWIDNNPFLQSINWCCAMDVAIRAVNWLWALAIMDDYSLPKSLSDKITGSLYQHGWYIFRNLEGNRFAYNGNHYYSDLVGLLHLGILFKKDAEGCFWYNFGKKELFREMRLQILPSGMHYEGSTNYHRLILELTLPCISLLKKNGQVVPPDVETRLKSMFDYVKLLVMPNGEMPIIGDQDNGRCLPFGVEGINDYRYLLELRSYLYEDENTHNIYCSLLKELKTNDFVSIIQQNKQQRLTLLKDAGFVLYKDDEWYCLINIDNQGMYRDETNSTGHTHADWLSFVLAYKGIPFIIDPGTYVYSSYPNQRNKFRSTSMHNTLCVDGKSQSDIPPKQLWSLPRKKAPHLNLCGYKEGSAIIECENSAFSTVEEEIVHKRTILICEKGVEINDGFVSQKDHQIDIFYYVDSRAVVNKNNGCWLVSNKGESVSLDIQSTSNYEVKVEKCEISEGYGSKASSSCIHIIMNGRELNVSAFINKLD